MRLDAASGGTSAASASGRSTGTLQGNCGTHHKSHVCHIYFYAANLGKQFFINAKRESAFMKLRIYIGWPIQGQSKTRTASAAWSKINTKIPAFFVCKIRFKLLAGAFGKLKHKKASTVLFLAITRSIQYFKYSRNVVFHHHTLLFHNTPHFSFCQLSSLDIVDSRLDHGYLHFPAEAKKYRLFPINGGSL